MSFLIGVIESFVHLDKTLGSVIQNYGAWTYALIFIIILFETGLVVTPFLPGDSLLFAAGTFAAIGSFNVLWLFILLAIAAILGDAMNYWIGRFVGPQVFSEDSIFFKKEYLIKTQKFYAKYGGKTIVIGRFMPIIRTFAPFVAGIGKMKYSRFLFYNIFGGMLWVAFFVFGGYWFGNIPWVKENFTLVILLIILSSLLPGIIEFINSKYRKRKTFKRREIRFR